MEGRSREGEGVVKKYLYRGGGGGGGGRRHYWSSGFILVPQMSSIRREGRKSRYDLSVDFYSLHPWLFALA